MIKKLKNNRYPLQRRHIVMTLCLFLMTLFLILFSWFRLKTVCHEISAQISLWAISKKELATRAQQVQTYQYLQTEEKNFLNIYWVNLSEAFTYLDKTREHHQVQELLLTTESIEALYADGESSPLWKIELHFQGEAPYANLIQYIQILQTDHPKIWIQNITLIPNANPETQQSFIDMHILFLCQFSDVLQPSPHSSSQNTETPFYLGE